MNVQDPNVQRDYIPISDHGLIGNLRTAALISTDGSVESYCIPNFDSPSVFARILDKYKGGHFSSPQTVPFTTKQKLSAELQCLTNEVRYLSFGGMSSRGTIPLRVECAPAFNYARDKHTTEIIPDDSVEYCKQHKVLFNSDSLNLDLRFVAESTLENVSTPEVKLDLLDLSEERPPWPSDVLQPLAGGRSACDESTDELGVPLERLLAGAKLRPKDDPFLTKQLLDNLFVATNSYWNSWIRKSTYQGSWKEAVHRSALALKLLIYEPTGAVVASPTFSLPEYIGGTRNWDYRYVSSVSGGPVKLRVDLSRASWIRDSSFTLYALIRLGFTQEANAYMDFIFERLKNKNPDGSLQIMYTIHGGKDLEEIELTHLDGHKGSKPVRIGNGAADHVQLDIYGELMDCIYLGQKFGRPLVRSVPSMTGAELTSYETVVRHVGLSAGTTASAFRWPSVRWLTSFSQSSSETAMNPIYPYGQEVRNKKRHFTYSKIMLWVAIDRGMCGVFHSLPFGVCLFYTSPGLRLADKRSLPCPRRNEWLAARDNLYEEIMHKAWNPTLQSFGQSYEETDVLDSSVLIMPLVFFMTPSDPRFVSTLKQIMKTPERGGLTSNNLVYRYDVNKSDDGVGGEEGTFCLCTLWCVEALTRAGAYERPLLQRATAMFEDFLLYSNHLGLCTEEISESGDGLGNAVQGFTHVTLISAAYNLSRTLADMK
ncbi:glycoside hydrolase family 15 protein [Melanogaster broomeanus]|nr:glycoside hydrolase family 15 protein [Melanogaster broomeanus]